MRYPKPFVLDGKWIVDLRAWGLGRHYRLGDAGLPEAEALNRAWARLTLLQQEQLTRPTAQLAFLPPGSAPQSFAGALDAWQPTKRYNDNPGNIAYGKQYAKAVRAELGAVALAVFCSSGGEERLRQYARELEGQGIGARTLRNRFSIVRQVLRFCTGAERRWLPYVPQLPELPAKPKPRFDWIGEPEFRALRARIYEGLKRGQLEGILAHEKIDCEPRLYVQRRRLYLSWLFYTGVRTEDANSWTADDVGLDVGVYVRHSTKTAAAPEQFELPDPLAADLRAYLRFCGREHFEQGERIGGGVWATVSKTLQRAAKALGISGVNPRILRRSFARKMFTLGYTIKQVSERMGHADQRMLNEIYVRTPRPAGVARSLWKVTVRDPHGPTPPPPKKVLAFAARGGTEDANAGENHNATKGEDDE